MFNWDKLSINFRYNVGQLTEKRLEKITNELKEKNINVNATLNPDSTSNVIVLILEDNGCVFIVTPDNIQYNTLNPMDKELCKKHMSAILDVFAAEELNTFLINAEGSSETLDSHSESVTSFNEKHNNVLSEHTYIYGIGYRFLVKKEYINGELKIEPMVSDKKKFYYQYIFNTINKVSIEQLFELYDTELTIDIDDIRGQI
jgi:hypothetical protein|uniref:Uncharacterized protein n=1 Tax=Myoviridae sp. ct2cn10 TaxID=2825022 RepID=A0A8S5PBX2_9CAUD|nr:hypothetical protein [uncultured Lachnoclostridium sp.]DAE03939.1 MAG TPA: hypothetical protein [Myoviridae sp. ct2cn10]